MKASLYFRASFLFYSINANKKIILIATLYSRDLKECAYASKYISFPNTNMRQNTNKSSYGRTISTDIRDEDIDLVPKRRAPLPPNQMTYTSSSAMISEVHKSPVRRPTEPPPPAPSIARMGSSFKS